MRAAAVGLCPSLISLQDVAPSLWARRTPPLPGVAWRRWPATSRFCAGTIR